ncbi:hypothetical protein HDG37_002919 [Paraburkholderia sp. MM5384-R2]|nr:hypothetical protein [Paraburkholderia sp. MM5384-R2]
MSNLWEINEAFTVVVIAAERELSLPHEQVNVHGGFCALGHPIDATGVRFIMKLLGALRQRGVRRGAATRGSAAARPLPSPSRSSERHRCYSEVVSTAALRTKGFAHPDHGFSRHRGPAAMPVHHSAVWAFRSSRLANLAARGTDVCRYRSATFRGGGSLGSTPESDLMVRGRFLQASSSAHIADD